MNKNSVLKYVGKPVKGLTPRKLYVVKAGMGDGVPRNDGTLGAYIQSDTQFVIHDDSHNCRICSFNENWSIVKSVPSLNKIKSAIPSPIFK